MTWLVDNDPYAYCFMDQCVSVLNKPYSFIYNFDESAGNFTLTIEAVNSSHADLVFACDDGNERKTITFNVTKGNISIYYISIKVISCIKFQKYKVADKINSYDVGAVFRIHIMLLACVKPHVRP